MGFHVKYIRINKKKSILSTMWGVELRNKYQYGMIFLMKKVCGIYEKKDL